MDLANIVGSRSSSARVCGAVFQFFDAIRFDKYVCNMIDVY